MKIEHNKNHPLLKRVEAIMDYKSGLHYSYDWGRIESEGGYPSDWIILGDLIIIATVDRDRPQLEICPVEEFLQEWEDRKAEFEEES